MKSRINILIILCCIFLLGACNKSEYDNEEQLPAGMVSIQLALPSLSSAKAADINQGSAAENYIGAVQVVIFTYTADHTGTAERVITIDPKKPVVDMQTVWNPATNMLSLRNLETAMPRNVYVIANATTANGYDPTAIKIGVTTEAQLLEVITQSTTLKQPTVQDGLFMSGVKRNHDFKVAPAMTVDLTRQAVKIKLNIKIDKAFADAFPTVKFDNVEGAFLNVYNVPSHSFVVGASPAKMPIGSPFLDFFSIAITKSGTGDDTKWEAEFYGYENPILGPTADSRKNSTQFIVRLPYKNGTATETENYYKFHITDPADTQNPHKTVRNHIYDLTATVAGFGSPTPGDGLIHVTTTVLDWNAVYLNTDVEGSYLHIKDIQAGATAMSELTYLDFKSYPLTIMGSSNKGGWMAELYIDGVLQQRSTLAVAGADNTVTLTLPANFKAGTAGLGRDIMIKIVDPNVRFMNYKGTTAINVTETKRQYGLGVDSKNLGAGQSHEYGFFYQFLRNTSFSSEISTPTAEIIGPISVAQSTGIYKNHYIAVTDYTYSWTNENMPQIWGEGVAADPCHKVSGDTWHVPSFETLTLFSKLYLNDNSLNGITGSRFGLDNTWVFLPAAGYREWGGMAIGYKGTGGRYWTNKNVIKDGSQEGAAFHFNLNGPGGINIYPVSSCYGMSIRCFSIGR